MFGAGFEADACEHHWTCDHMCLAWSTDQTPAIVHGSPSIQSSDNAFKHVLANSVSLSRINGESKIIELNVLSPESTKKSRRLRLHVITLLQQYTISDCEQYLHKTEFSVSYLTNLQYFGNNDVLPNVDATVILGSFQLEENFLPPKVLLVRISGMLSNSRHSQQEKETMARNITIASDH